MLLTDDRLPFCCKFTTNCNAELIAVRSTGHARFYIIVHSQLVLVKLFEAGGLAQSHDR